MTFDMKGGVNWEMANPLRLAAGADFPALEQHMWRLDGGGILEATAPIEGSYSMPDSFLDATVMNDHYGEVGAMSQDYRFYCMRYQLGYGILDAFSADGNVQVGDVYGIARCGSKLYAPGGLNRYLGIGFQVSTKTAGVVTGIKFCIISYGASGAPFGSAIQIDPNETTVPMASSVWLALRSLKVGAGAVNVRLKVGGAWTGVGVNPGAVLWLRDAYMGPTNKFWSGAGTDGGARMIRDLMVWGDGASDTDVPGTTWSSAIYQPVAIGTQDTWTGVGDGTNKHNDVNDKRNDCPGSCDYIVPVAAGSSNRQTFTFPAWAGGTPLGVYIVWEQGSALNANAHRVVAQTTGGGLQLASAVIKGGYHGGLGAMCDSDPKSAWFGRWYPLTPEGSAWTSGLFTTLEAGLESVSDGGAWRHVGEFYALVFGTDIVQPGKTACPSGRRFAAFI